MNAKVQSKTQNQSTRAPEWSYGRRRASLVALAPEADIRRTVLQTKTHGNYIVDFYAPAAQLVVEVDGSQHAELTQAKYDERRSEYLENLGLRVLRFDDRQVLLQPDAVAEEIFRVLTNPS